MSVSSNRKHWQRLFIYTGVNGWHVGSPQGILHEAKDTGIETDTIPDTGLPLIPQVGEFIRIQKRR